LIYEFLIYQIATLKFPLKKGDLGDVKHRHISKDYDYNNPLTPFAKGELNR